MEYIINGKRYELITNYKDGFVLDDVESKLTDYFDRFDYVCGDWAYRKLRLKGFMESNSKGVKSYNNIKFLDRYLKDNCASEARYFLIKRVYE